MHHMTKLFFISLIFSAVVGAAENSPVVATVGNKTITLEEFNRRYEDVKRRAVNPPPKRLFLEDLVRYEMGIQEAEKRNLEKDPVIAERLREQLYTGLVEKDLSEKISAITISEDEMKDYYKSSPELRTSHILVEIKGSATPEERAAAMKRAKEIYSDVKKSKRPFEELVKLYSDDLATKKNGGDVGYQTRVSVVPAYYEAAVHLKMGQISEPTETPYGVHIIKLTAIHSYKDANKRQVRAAIYEKKKLAIFNEYFDKIKKNYKVSVNQDLLK
jgi:parvulin-like peptidyl-prolyl isomerase